MHGLASRLRRYKIKPARSSDDEERLRGYLYIDKRPRHNDLERVFEKYLPPEPNHEPNQPNTIPCVTASFIAYFHASGT